ncbi:MAG: hypothetical protein J6W31_08115, partial [Clostridia bacterium]|nr:hypothetical protein [Clostridia bacterium]
MNKIAKQILCAILLAVMLISVVACASQEMPSSQSDTSDGVSADISGEVSEDPNAKYLDEEGRYVTKLGVLDEYKGRTFTVVVRSEYYGTYQSDDFTTETGGNGGIDYG